MNTELILLAVGSLAAYVSWTIIYRLFLHPLAKIPGPLLPKTNSLYEMYYEVWHYGKYPFKIKELHKRYGPILRPVPDEVHIDDPDFLDTIYALRNRNNPTQRGLLVDQSVGGAEDFHLHKIRREALNPYFSHKAVMSMEDLILEKRDQVTKVFEQAARSGQVLNLSDVYFGFSNDLVRNFSFGSDSGLLGDLGEARVQRENLSRLLTSVKINKHFPFIPRVLGKYLPMMLGERGIPPAVMDLLKFKGRAKVDIEAVMKDTNNDRKGRHSVFYELRDSEILPPEEKTVARLQDEATLLVMAGTESMAKSIGYGSFYLNHYPKTLEKLREELRRATEEEGKEEVSLKTLLKLPYLNAVVTETNRLSFGVTNRLARYSPTETLSYTASYGPHKGTTYTFPPGTKMSCVTYCTHTNEDLFPDPFTFDPERFMGQSEAVNKRKRCMMALGKGHRRCLGINVAQSGMCLVLAVVAGFEMELYETGYEDVAFLHDYQVATPRLDSKGIRVRVKGRKGE
ncbi:hypothetical protein PRZ48_003740 [Zasmidium cellare]|uniref:Cytochrome P450 n=1 Tax=Zasmidium cellare TaxID=395010 RepID=A0ABR0EWH4_ZASCE|nr:hypothetical protein PRZ48_003740 [Zasmidium cellare]